MTSGDHTETGRLHEIDGFRIVLDDEKYSRAIVARIEADRYENAERALVRDLLRDGDRVLEAGTAIGVVAMVAAARVGVGNVVTFDANPAIVADARRNFDHNGLPIRANVGALRNRARWTGDARVPFHLSRHFWASRLAAKPSDADIVDTVDVPLIALEDEIAKHQATVLICDIEGDEAELLIDADLGGIRLIIVEIHPWLAGQARIDAMVRYLIGSGFNLDFASIRGDVIVFRR